MRAYELTAYSHDIHKRQEKVLLTGRVFRKLHKQQTYVISFIHAPRSHMSISPICSRAHSIYASMENHVQTEINGKLMFEK